MVTQKEFHKEILKTLGGENPPSEHRCPQYRYYRPGDHECPYGTVVVWEIEHKRNVYTWCFDRAIYERESLAMLKDMVERHIGWNGLVSPEYDSYEEFCDDVRRLGVKGMFPEVEG